MLLFSLTLGIGSVEEVRRRTRRRRCRAARFNHLHADIASTGADEHTREVKDKLTPESGRTNRKLLLNDSSEAEHVRSRLKLRSYTRDAIVFEFDGWHRPKQRTPCSRSVLLPRK